ncbi:ZIP family metal transporter [Patescibacteria group bacterium]|nr:ZIP family metal transporter [Patescibacteria group bacterium]
MILALFLSVIAGMADILGGFLAIARKVDSKILAYFIAVSSGFILAVTVLDLYPEVIRELDYGPVLILVGFTAIFILDNFFAVHAHEGKKGHEHTMLAAEGQGERLEKHSVWAAYIGLLIHTFFDGAAISARVLASPAAGILTFIAVLSHKVPEGFSMSSIFRAGKFSRIYAFVAAATLGFATILGAVVIFLSGHSEFSLIFLALATGSFTYIAGSELVPLVSSSRDRKGIMFFLVGILLFYLTSISLSQAGWK